MASQTDALIDQAKKIEQCITPNLYWPVLISLFCKLAGVSMTDTDALIKGGNCIEQCIPHGHQLPVLIYLANQILTGGGGTSGGLLQLVDGTSVTPNINAPAGPPLNPAQIAIFVGPAGTLSIWSPVQQAWVALISLS